VAPLGGAEGATLVAVAAAAVLGWADDGVALPEQALTPMSAAVPRAIKARRALVPKGLDVDPLPPPANIGVSSAPIGGGMSPLESVDAGG
jgi:hypothetical protein